jgi:DNA-binding MarR family transcriptional regulator
MIMVQAGDDAGLYGDATVILILADSDYTASLAEEAVTAAGGRAGAAHPIEGAVEWLETRPRCDVAIVEVEEDRGEPFDLLIAQLNRAAEEGRYRSIVSVPVELIDAAAAQAVHDGVQLLCAARPMDRAAALALALSAASGAGAVHEPGRAQLRRLSEDAARIAAQLALLADAPREEHRGPVPVAGQAGAIHPPEASTIRALIKARRMRDQYFTAELFADPAWDILLDLMAARSEGVSVAVSSLCIAAAVPPTTALRWIRMMTEEKLILRAADPHDRRRIHIKLSDEAAASLSAYFAAVAKSGVLLG